MIAALLWSLAALLASVVLYRLLLSPLARARVPGPRLAAITGMYEMYYDLKLGGRFPWKLAELHREYGPIVRITPDQVHIDDPDFVTTFFSSTALRGRYGPHQRQLGVPLATVGTLEYNAHRHRRAGLAPFLSSKNVNGPAISGLIRSKLDLMDLHLARAQETGTVVDLRLLCWALMTDIVSDLAFHDGRAMLNDDELDATIKDFQEGGQRIFHFFKHFPFLWNILHSIPPAWLISMEPGTRRLVQWEERQKEHVAKAIAGRRDSNSTGPVAGAATQEQLGRTVYEHLLASSALSEEDKYFGRIWQESASLLGAGVATVTNALCTILFHLMDCPSTMDMLRAELKTVVPEKASAIDLPSTSELLRLPYLNAVVNEGLRLSFGLTQRIARVAPYEVLTYQQYHIPPGTAIGMSSMLTHTNPAAFPKPRQWKPERWLEDQDQDQKSQRELLLTFGKGARQCLGIHLAHAEILSALALMVSKYDLQLFETTKRDVDVAFDQLLPVVAAGSKGVRVRLFSSAQ